MLKSEMKQMLEDLINMNNAAVMQLRRKRKQSINKERNG